MIKIAKKQNIMDQHFLVREYFTKIGNEDPYNLDVEGFFERVCNSIANNGLEKTCEIYNLDIQKIKLIKNEENKMQVEIRFLKEGLVNVEAPKGFENWTTSEKEDWANETLRALKQEKGDIALLEAMAHLPNPTKTGKYFDEAPQVAAIEADYGETTLYETSEWKEFKIPNDKKYLVFISYCDAGGHSNLIANGIKEVSNIVYRAFKDEEISSKLKSEIDWFINEVNTLEVANSDIWNEFSNDTWITVTLVEE